MTDRHTRSTLDPSDVSMDGRFLQTGRSQTNMKPDTVLGVLIPAAKTFLERDGSIGSVAVLGSYTKGIIGTVPMDSTSDRDKRAHVLALRDTARLAGADWVIYMAEAWTVRRPADTPNPSTIVPSKESDRQEAFIITVSEKDHEARLGVAYIDRSGPFPTFSTIEWTTGAIAGQMVDLLG